MIIDVIVCRSDGTQELEQREVPETWFETPQSMQSDVGEQVQ